MLAFLKNEDLRIEAYKELGVFITTLAGTNIDKKLIDYYLSMTDMSITSSTKIANEVIHFFLHPLLHYKGSFPMRLYLSRRPANTWPPLLALTKSTI